MIANANSGQTLLLVLPDKREIYPLNPVALMQAQSSRRKLASDYANALILYQDGNVRRIDRITVIGPWGQSFGRKLLSRLTDAWQIDVQLSQPMSWALEELKRLIVDCLDAQGVLGFPALDDQSYRQQVIAGVMGAHSLGQIFEILKVPPVEKALDVL